MRGFFFAMPGNSFWGDQVSDTKRVQISFRIFKIRDNTEITHHWYTKN
jgi:hypothetical protein